MDKTNKPNEMPMIEHGSKPQHSEISTRTKLLNILMLFVPFVSMVSKCIVYLGSRNGLSRISSGYLVVVESLMLRYLLS